MLFDLALQNDEEEDMAAFHKEIQQIEGEDGTFAGEVHTSMSVRGSTLSVGLPAGSATVITLTP